MEFFKKSMKSIGLVGMFYIAQIISTTIVIMFKLAVDIDWFYDLIEVMDTYTITSKEYVNKIMELMYSSMIISDILLLVPSLIYIRVKKISVLSKIDIRSVTIFIAIGVVINSIVSFIVDFLPESNSIISDYNSLMNSVLTDNKVIAILTIGVLAPIIEEFLFRFGLINMYKQYGYKFAIILSALFFGIAHFNLVQSSYAFVIGLILGYIYVRTKNLLSTIIIHLTVNTSSLIYEYFNQYSNAFHCIIALCFLYIIVIYVEGGLRLSENCFE